MPDHRRDQVQKNFRCSRGLMEMVDRVRGQRSFNEWLREAAREKAERELAKLPPAPLEGQTSIEEALPGVTLVTDRRMPRRVVLVSNGAPRGSGAHPSEVAGV